MEDFRNEYCMHTATCGQLRATDVNQEVTLCGWAWHTRDHGGLIFIDLRDRDGYTQVVVDPDCVSEEDFHAAEHLGREYVLKVSGRVRERAPEAINPNMITGEIEVLANAVQVLNTSVTPPFSIEDGIETDEITRMKWRYLDIRRPEMLANLKLRHTVTQAMRRALDERGFLEIETPILANSTPEGARDYIVPSRPNPGKFYALPQSPQQFKQMLMCAGVERYYQIARCFRDEDLRADRQPEFTQVDIEMSFVEGDDVCDMMEGVMAETLKAVGVTDVAFPLQKMQYADAMRLYGCDRPDVRFGMLLHDITDIVKDTGFKVFASVAQSGGVVKAINVKGAGDWSRGEVEKLASIAEANGAKGMAWVAFTTDGQEKSPIKKFFTDEEWAALKAEMEVEPGDLLLFAADKPEIANAVLSALRLHMADAMNIPREGHALLWVVNFPMFRYDEDEKKYAAEHHPFTHVLKEDLDKIESYYLPMQTLQCLAVRLAVDLATNEDIDELEHRNLIFRRMAADNNTEGLLMADHAFHEKILAIAGNAYIQEFCSALWVPIARLDYLFFRDNHMASSAQDHRTIIDSFRIRDPFGAELAMKNNWNYSMLAVEASASTYEYEH
mgnify:CR=1 FL=1